MYFLEPCDADYVPGRHAELFVPFFFFFYPSNWTSVGFGHTKYSRVYKFVPETNEYACYRFYSWYQHGSCGGTINLRHDSISTEPQDSIKPTFETHYLTFTCFLQCPFIYYITMKIATFTFLRIKTSLRVLNISISLF